MENLHVHIGVNSDLYEKNPETSELGRKIILGSIVLINKLGFEDFTFKKLGEYINSPESSIYRYFKNKHILLLYLTNWYWTWTEYRIVFATSNIKSPEERLKISIDILTQPVLVDNSFSYVDNVLLSKIIFSESIKSYHTKDVDTENKRGFYKAYKSVVQRVGAIILEINPPFEFPHMLVSTVIEGAHQQKYFSEHLPSLTDCIKDKHAISNFYKNLVFNSIK
jgi:AcrR family transcriptional regulator